VNHPPCSRLACRLAIAWSLLSLGGLLLHLRIHPVEESIYNWTPAVIGLVNVLVLPPLFLRARTAGFALLAAWFTVIVGTAGMAWHTATTWMLPLTALNLLLKSTLADILILGAKLPLAHVLFALARAKDDVAGSPERGCRP